MRQAVAKKIRRELTALAKSQMNKTSILTIIKQYVRNLLVRLLMKGKTRLVFTDGEGKTFIYEGRDAENMMFFSTIGSEFFNTLPVTCVLKDKFVSLQAYVKECCTSDSFRDMFLRAVVNDSVEDWNALVDTHYGGRKGLVALSQELADKLRTKYEKVN